MIESKDTTQRSASECRPEESVATRPAGHGPERWRLWRILLLGWCLPQTMGGRTAHFSPARCLTYHLTASVVTLLVILVMAGAYEGDSPLSVLTEIMSELGRFPIEIILSLLGTALGIEGCFLGLGLCLSPWGAKDELLGTSVAFGIRRVWLSTGFVILPIIVNVSLAIGLDHASRAVSARMLGPRPVPHWSLPEFRLPKPRAPEVQAKIDRAAEAWSEYQTRWNATVPWYWRNWETIVMLGVALSAVWFLWAVLRVVSADRPQARNERPPLCERCGYNLTTMARESRCPECGFPVESSIGDGARSGTAWDRHAGCRGPAIWWRTLFDAATSPKQFGRSIQLTTGNKAYRSLLALNLAIVGMIALVSFSGLAILESRNPPPVAELIGILTTIVLLITTTAVVLNLLLPLAAATLVGLWFARAHRRNLLPTAVQMACYASGFQLVWALIFVACGAVIYLLETSGYMQVLAGLLDLAHSTILLVLFWTPNVICLTIYLGIILAGTSSTKYANK